MVVYESAISYKTIKIISKLRRCYVNYKMIDGSLKYAMVNIYISTVRKPSELLVQLMYWMFTSVTFCMEMIGALLPQIYNSTFRMLIVVESECFKKKSPPSQIILT